jgi:hypothetical protein
METNMNSDHPHSHWLWPILAILCGALDGVLWLIHP